VNLDGGWRMTEGGELMAAEKTAMFF